MSRFAKTLGVLALFTPGLAFADVKACVESHASGQREMKAAHLKAAAARFTACGSDSNCPAEIKAECVQFLREAERNLPTVVLVARDHRRGDVGDVRVYDGDELLTDRLDGGSVALDPGHHTLRFVFPNGAVTTETLRVEPGERDRRISVFEPAPEPTPAKPKRALTAPFWLAAGAGAVGLTSWGVFALLGRGGQASVERCAPRCDEGQRGDYDAMRRNYLIADVSLGVGLAASGVATWLWLAQPSPATRLEKPRETARLTLVPTLTPSKIELTLRATTF